jgi:hypothetical protein
MALFEKVGMKREGKRRDFYFRDGAYHDAHLFSILRADWRRLVQSGGEITEGAAQDATSTG